MKIIIKPDATVVKIYDKEFDEQFNLRRNRVSHVEPINTALRGFFHLIRKRVSDDSKLAEWTRRWRCQWRARIFDGPTLGPFTDRQKAIDAEVQWLLENILKG